MARRPKFPDVTPSGGNPTWRQYALLKGRVDNHETRITATEERVAQINLEMAILADMAATAHELAIRARRRAAAWAPPKRR
jgi:hypothetical protein